MKAILKRIKPPAFIPTETFFSWCGFSRPHLQCTTSAIEFYRFSRDPGPEFSHHKSARRLSIFFSFFFVVLFFFPIFLSDTIATAQSSAKAPRPRANTIHYVCLCVCVCSSLSLVPRSVHVGLSKLYWFISVCQPPVLNTVVFRCPCLCKISQSGDFRTFCSTVTFE